METIYDRHTRRGMMDWCTQNIYLELSVSQTLLQTWGIQLSTRQQTPVATELTTKGEDRKYVTKHDVLEAYLMM